MKLIVSDFFKDITYIYTMDKRILDREIDELLKDMGYGPANCQWMLTKNDIIIK